MRVTTECPHCGKSTRIDLSAETTTQKCHHCGKRLSAVPTGWDRDETMRPHIDEEDSFDRTPDHETGGKKSPRFLTSFGLASTGLILAFIYYYTVKNRGSNSELPDSSPTTTSANPHEKNSGESAYDAASKIFPSAKKVAELALNAETLDQLRPHLDRESSLSQQRLEKYHSSIGPLPLPLGFKKILPINHCIHFPTEKVFLLNYIDLKNQTRTIPFHEYEDGTLKIDWPAFVAENPETLTEYAKKPATVPTSFRVILMPDNYFNFDFNDETKHYCFKLTDPHTQESIYGYVPTTSPLGEISRAYQLFADSVQTIVNIIPPKNPRSHNQVEITEFVHNKWIIPYN